MYACGTVWRDRKGFLMTSTTSSCHSEGSIKPCSETSWLRQCGETRCCDTLHTKQSDHRRQKNDTRVCLALKMSTSTTATWDEWTSETSFESTFMFGSSVRKIVSTKLIPPSQMHLFCHSTVHSGLLATRQPSCVNSQQSALLLFCR